MKTLRYLLMATVLLLLPMASVTGQEAFDFRSTSAMPWSGSGIQTAAQTGVMLSGSTPSDGGVPAGAPGGPRRGKMDDDPWGGGTIDDVNKPEEPGTPIGDGVWVLLLLAAGLLGYRKARAADAKV